MTEHVTVAFSVAPTFRLNSVTSFALAQTLGQVGDPCTLGVDACGIIAETPGSPEEQIECGLDNICGGKGAYCLIITPNSGGYTEACVSRTFAHPFNSIVDTL